MLKRWLADLFYVTPIASLYRALRDTGLIEGDEADTAAQVAAIRGAIGVAAIADKVDDGEPAAVEDVPAVERPGGRKRKA
jgi:hypothetical protein